MRDFPSGVHIVDAATLRPCGPDEEGELWVCRPAEGGYWNRAAEAPPRFEAQVCGKAHFRTGDRGLLRAGVLYVTGRAGDRVQLGGKPYDLGQLERTAERAHPALRRSSTAVLTTPVGTGLRVVVLCEVERRVHQRRSDRAQGGQRRQTTRRLADTEPTTAGLQGPTNLDEVTQQIRAAIGTAFGVAPYAVLLLRAGSIPKRSTGRVDRAASKSAFGQGQVDVLSEWRDKAVELEPARFTSREDLALHLRPHVTGVVSRVIGWSGAEPLTPTGHSASWGSARWPRSPWRPSCGDCWEPTCTGRSTSAAAWSTTTPPSPRSASTSPAS